MARLTGRSGAGHAHVGPARSGADGLAAQGVEAAQVRETNLLGVRVKQRVAGVQSGRAGLAPEHRLVEQLLVAGRVGLPEDDRCRVRRPAAGHDVERGQFTGRFEDLLVERGRGLTRRGRGQGTFGAGQLPLHRRADGVGEPDRPAVVTDDRGAARQGLFVHRCRSAQAPEIPGPGQHQHPQRARHLTGDPGQGQPHRDGAVGVQAQHGFRIGDVMGAVGLTGLGHAQRVLGAGRIESADTHGVEQAHEPQALDDGVGHGDKVNGGSGPG